MQPFNQIPDWKNNLEHFFGDRFWNEFEDVLKPPTPMPQTNIYQQEKEITCYVSIPGVRNIDDIQVYVNDSHLEIIGEIPLEHARGQLIQDEISHGSFQRKIDLPFPVRSDKVSASYRSGLLVLRLHRLIQQNFDRESILVKNLDIEDTQEKDY